MARLIPIPNDPRQRFACSECLARTNSRLDVQYVFEFADQAKFGDDHFELLLSTDGLGRRNVGPGVSLFVFGVPGIVLCVSCRLAAGAQRRPGQPVPGRETPIRPHVAFDPTTLEEVDVPPGASAEPQGGWFESGDRLI
jgi:hypothetical protein